jgi:hypothetical protein
MAKRRRELCGGQKIKYRERPVVARCRLEVLKLLGEPFVGLASVVWAAVHGVTMRAMWKHDL